MLAPVTPSGLDQRTVEWIRGLVAIDRGDRERTARFLRKVARCSIREARVFIAEAMEGER